MAITTTESSLLRLMQLSSVSLPVGGYAFSQGLEFAVEQGWVTSMNTAGDWLELQMHDALARVDLPIIQRAYAAAEDPQALAYWNAMALACRETRELRLTDTAMGEALLRLLPKLGIALPLPTEGDISFVLAFALVAHHWQLPLEAAQLGYAWSWLENQVAAATKLIPLGQTQSQQLLGELQTHVESAMAVAASLDDDQLGASLPALAIASARHEVQYTRLFRS